MADDIIQSVYYNQMPDTVRRKIAVLLHRVWPEEDGLPEDTIPTAHDEALNARSFYAYADGKLVSYTGVVSKAIEHEGERFRLSGLSCVATDPDYRGLGYGLKTVTAATRWMEQSGVDLGIFTCHPALADFYHRAGSWPAVPDVSLIGSRDEGALTSDSLQVAVLMRLFSAKAIAHKKVLRNTTIHLDLPVGQFL
ncbi:GNAT family N-acetyltransferase [Paenibacillus sp. cl6col]|uniref:GNAT family N-acetyltransferase n=1 Tax=Paenibacillus sp. cl6col TaxID=1761878 RepID=UPI000B8A0402|nr:GNAT family N-acetyltransferase [Paenibacillus sp. cl6col]